MEQLLGREAAQRRRSGYGANAIDPHFRRIAAIHGIDRRRIYDGALNPVAQFDATGALTAVFVYGSTGHCPMDQRLVSSATAPLERCRPACFRWARVRRPALRRSALRAA